MPPKDLNALESYGFYIIVMSDLIYYFFVDWICEGCSCIRDGPKVGLAARQCVDDPRTWLLAPEEGNYFTFLLHFGEKFELFLFCCDEDYPNQFGSQIRIIPVNPHIIPK